MTKNFQTILTPLLMTSYVFGLRIANLSSHSRLWFSILYLLLVWSFVYFFSILVVIFFFYDYPIEKHLCFWLEIFTTFSSLMFSIYYSKNFQTCLKKLDLVDNTLLQLGTVTDYNKLRKKTEWLVFVWFVIVVTTNFITALLVKKEYNYNLTTAILFSYMKNYYSHINIIDDLITAIILKYIGLKFDQVNEHLQNLTENNHDKMRQAWENFVENRHQCRFAKTLNKKCTIWVIIHLHVELRKISYEIDAILGKQMTFNMACYFAWTVIDLREILYTILVKNYVKSRITFVAHHGLWLTHNVSKFLLINYMCETVTVKANKIADLLNGLSYFTCDVELRAIISQFSLQTMHAPVRFCGIGFFQFGYKFLHRFIMSIATVLVIIIQAYTNK